MKTTISLKTALFSIVLLASVAPLMVTGPWIWQRAQYLLLETSLEKEATRNEVLKNEIVFEGEKVLVTFKNKADPLAFVTERAKIKTLLDAIIRREELVDVVMLLNREGSVVASSSREPGLSHDEYKKFLDRGEYQIPLRGRTYISPTELDHGLWHFNVAVPVGPAGQPTGILFAVVDAEKLWHHIQEEQGFLYPGVKTYVVDNYGRLFFAGFETGIERGALLSHIPIVRSMVAGKEWKKAQVYTGLDGKQVFGSGSHIDLLDWGIVTEVPVEAVKEPVSKAMLSLAAIFISIAFLFSSLSILISRRMAKPLSELVNIFHDAKNGKYRTFVQPSGVKEIAELAEGFNLMTSAIKEKEEMLQKAMEKAEEANRLKSEFLNTMNHELRTPLTVILGNIPLLTDEKDLPEPKEVAEIARDMEKSARHLLTLINDLLDISKIEAGKMTLNMEAVSAASVIDDAVSTISVLAQKKGIAVEAKADDMMIKADPVRLKQILLNLLSNAVKFTDKGGIMVIVERDGDSARFKVTDTGCGMREEDLPYIFDVFRQVDSSSTRNVQGSGLGLAITKKLVELHGGNISVESRFGEGSVFTFTMPAGNMEERGSL